MNKEIKNSFKIKKVLKIFLFIFIITLIIFYFYIRYIEPKIIIVKENSIINSNLPKEFNGFKIAHFSDIHYGSTITDKELNKIVKKINELNPDVIVFTGDLFNESIKTKEESFDSIKKILSNLKAKYRKYAVLGDHDYSNKDKYLEIMNESGFKILENDTDLLYVMGNNPLEFIGTSSILSGENKIDQAIKNNENDDYYKIWLNHEPIIFDSLITNNLYPNILLVGHTLGGLIDIPFYGYLLKQDGVNNYNNNFYRKKRIRMYINNGLGTFKYNIRLGNTPSINFYRLYNK